MSQRRGAYPVDGRTVALLVDDTIAPEAVDEVRAALLRARVRPLVVAAHDGEVAGTPVDRSFATMRSIEFDGAMLLAGPLDPRVDLLLAELWRHGKAIAAVGTAASLLQRIDADPRSPGVTVDDAVAATAGLLTDLSEHRAWARIEAAS